MPMQLSAYKLVYQDIDGKIKTIEIQKKVEQETSFNFL
jgi:hypothetical protein